MTLDDRSSFGLLVAMAVCRLLAGLAIIKILSSTFGPAKFGTLSHIMGIAALIFMFAGGGVTNGIIHFVSADRSDASRQGWLAAARDMSILSGAVLGLIGVALYFFGAETLLGDRLLVGVLAIALSAARISHAHTHAV